DDHHAARSRDPAAGRCVRHRRGVAKASGRGQTRAPFRKSPRRQSFFASGSRGQPDDDKMKALSILLADDDEDVRALFELSLKRRGHRVATASTGREALAQLAREKFDVLITDIVMPEVDGLDVIKAARKSAPSLRVIAVSGGG